MTRTVLTSNLTVYINSGSGSDTTGNGTSDAPFATLQHTRDVVQQGYDLGGKYSVTYNANGNFTAGVLAMGPLVGQRSDADEMFLFAAGSNVTAPTDSKNMSAMYGAMFRIYQPDNNLTLNAPGSAGVGLAASSGGIINVMNTITLSNCGGHPIETSWGGTIIVNSLYTTGNAEAFVFVSGGVVQFNPGNTTYFVGNITYSKATMWSYGGGMLGINGQTFGTTGTVTGKRYAAEFGGSISCGCNGAPNYFPGNQAGYTSLGGQYY